MSHSMDMEREAASVAFDQVAWWKSRGLFASEAAVAMGLPAKSSWIVVECALRNRWREAIQIKEDRDHRSAA